MSSIRKIYEYLTVEQKKVAVTELKADRLYQWVLKLNGWEKVGGELTPIYQKDDKKIDLIATTDHMSVLKVE